LNRLPFNIHFSTRFLKYSMILIHTRCQGGERHAQNCQS
jgi:hypothetical protein